MKDPVAAFVSQAEQEAVEACVREVEARTRGEIAVMLVPASDTYPMAALLGAAALSFPAALALTPLIGGLVWAGPANLWVFLSLLLPLFLGFHQLVGRMPLLKRLFVRPGDMEEEVAEAAHVAFCRKGLYRTREETGVLLYVSLFERRVHVLGDRGIHAAVTGKDWEEVVAEVTGAIKEGRAAEGICRAVQLVGRILEKTFPPRPGDRDELENVLVGP